jgi:hypothetical protein
VFSFKNKTILIISPQAWGVMHVSKHHYAIELAKRGNTVYFLNPPDESLQGKCNIEVASGYENLYTVSYKPYFPFSIRFKLRILFDLLMKVQVKRILKILPQKPDVTWCFDPNLFSDLRCFKADVNIYHPVDPVIYNYQYRPALTVDVVFTVSDDILSGFKKFKTPGYFINHGLNDDYACYAREKLTKVIGHITPSNTIKAGYIGNMLRGIIDHRLIIRLIQDFKQVEFHFWGSYEMGHANLSGGSNAEITNFLHVLKTSSNVVLHGPKPAREILKEIDEIDVFFLFYNEKAGESDRSNAHKILEYLSTGKVMVSNLFTTYKDRTDLLCMPQNGDDSYLYLTFQDVINNIHVYNAPENMKKRMEFALDNLYDKQVDKIEKIIISLSEIIH